MEDRLQLLSALMLLCCVCCLQLSAEWACRDKGQVRSTCEALMQLAEENKVDMLVLGSWGRKGEKM
jgi:hypothetical protein